jgi:hypothetical protein
MPNANAQCINKTRGFVQQWRCAMGIEDGALSMALIE